MYYWFIFRIFIFIAFVRPLPHVVKTFLNTVKGYRQIKKIHTNPYMGISIENTGYDEKARSTCITSGILFALCIPLLTYWLYMERNPI